MDSDAGEGPSTSGAGAAGAGFGVASAAVSRCGTPGLMSVPDTLACSQLLPPSASVTQEEEGSCSDLDLSRMTLSPGTSTSPSTESRKCSFLSFYRIAITKSSSVPPYLKNVQISGELFLLAFVAALLYEW